MAVVQMITSDKFGSATLPVEVPAPLSAQTIIAAAAKKFKTVSKQSRAYHGTTGMELAGPVTLEELEGSCVVVGPKAGWKGAIRLSEQAEAQKSADAEAAKAAVEIDTAPTEEPSAVWQPTHEELVEAAQSKRSTGVVLCWRDTQENGYLTNWAKSPFVIDGVEYSCAEQSVMASKARLVGNDRILEQIMKARLPKQHKALGRTLDRQVVAKVWRNPQKWEAQLHSARAKFGQNPALAVRLLRTGEKPIAEASPSDNIFGIGLAPSDPLAQDPANWKGTNILGKALMQVRTELRDKLLGKEAGGKDIEPGATVGEQSYDVSLPEFPELESEASASDQDEGASDPETA